MFNEDFNYYCFKNEPGVLLDPDGVHAPNELRHQHRNVMRSLSGAIIKRHMDK